MRLERFAGAKKFRLDPEDSEDLWKILNEGILDIQQIGSEWMIEWMDEWPDFCDHRSGAVWRNGERVLGRTIPSQEYCQEWNRETHLRDFRELTRRLNKAGWRRVQSRKRCRFWLQSLNSGAFLEFISIQVLAETTGNECASPWTVCRMTCARKGRLWGRPAVVVGRRQKVTVREDRIKPEKNAESQLRIGLFLTRSFLPNVYQRQTIYYVWIHLFPCLSIRISTLPGQELYVPSASKEGARYKFSEWMNEFSEWMML